MNDCYINDALRIKVIEENDEAVQYVDNYAYFSVDFFDVTDKISEERKEYLKYILLLH